MDTDFLVSDMNAEIEALENKLNKYKIFKTGHDAKFINRENKAGMSQGINSIQPITADIKKLIEKSRQNVALAVNAEITLLYWHIGKRIKTEILGNERAEYGKKLIAGLSKQLTLEYGKGWSKRHLHHCIRITEIFPDIEIVHALRSQLSWTHLRLISPPKKLLQEKLHKAVEIAQQKIRAKDHE